jgi:hypothetical protein
MRKYHSAETHTLLYEILFCWYEHYILEGLNLQLHLIIYQELK